MLNVNTPQSELFLSHRSGARGQAENELEVLRAVHLFGHLRRTEIAIAVWPASPPKSAYILACAAVRRMQKKRLLLERPNSLGGMSFVLSRRGAAVLKEKLNIDAIGGHDLSPDGPQFFHRTIGTTYLLEKSREPGAKVFGEYALIRGWGPVKREYVKLMFGKIPDGFIVRSGKSAGLRDDAVLCDWIEVESAFKPYEDVFKIFSMLRKSSQLNAEGTAFLDKVVVVYDGRQKHEIQLLKFLLRFIRENPALSSFEITNSVVFVNCHIDLPLSWKGFTERTAAEMLNDPTIVKRLGSSL